MSIRVSYFVPPAQLTAARAAGKFEGLGVADYRTTSSDEQLTGLLAGTLDVAITAIDNLFEWAQRGADVRLVAQVEVSTHLSLVAAPGIQSIEDLVHRPFAVDAMRNGFSLIARHLLNEAGILVNFVEVGGVAERFAELVDGRVAATLLGPPFVDRALAAGCRVLVDVQQTLPDYPGQGLVVQAARLHEPDILSFLAVLGAHGLFPVDSAGLELLTRLRTDLGLPADVDLLKYP